eukprot:Awhi_evm1s10663
MLSTSVLISLAAVTYGLPVNQTTAPPAAVTEAKSEVVELQDLKFPSNFLFGASSAATQIEENNTHTDWWWYGLPEVEGGLGKLKTPVGDAAMGYSMVTEDIQLMEELNINSYRFSIEWGRIWPNGPNAPYDQDALAHYRKQIVDMKAIGVKPMVTIHHFSNPIWVEDFVNASSTDPKNCTVTETNLCGWAGPNQKGIIEALVKHTELLATELGDIVDDWCTVNEPVNYILAGWGLAAFPPGHSYLMDGHFDALIDVFRGFLEAHSQMYDALKEKDTQDADGDGIVANVGYTLSVAEWTPTQGNKISSDPADIAAAENTEYVYNHFFTQSIVEGQFDVDWSRNASTMEPHPEWKGKLDFVGLQYYFRTGVTATPALLAPVKGTPCMPGSGLDFGSCLPKPDDPNHWVPSMGYEYWEDGTYNILTKYNELYPGLPLIVTESGLASNNGVRRSEHIVRNLEQIHRAITDGADVRGYFHWSLTDNFEWAEGFDPHFGLYRMEDPYNGNVTRVATAGALTYRDILNNNGTVSIAMREKFGGYGPMTPETDEAGDFPDAQPKEVVEEENATTTETAPPVIDASCATVELQAWMGDCIGDAIVTADLATNGTCKDVVAMGLEGSAKVTLDGDKLVGEVFVGPGCPGTPMISLADMKTEICNTASPASVKIKC